MPVRLMTDSHIVFMTEYTLEIITSINAFKSRLNAHWKGHPHKFNPACYETGANTGLRNYPNASLQG